MGCLGRAASAAAFGRGRGAVVLITDVITGVELDGKDVTVFVRYVVVDRVMYGLLYLDKAASPTMTPAFASFVASLTF